MKDVRRNHWLTAALVAAMLVLPLVPATAQEDAPAVTEAPAAEAPVAEAEVAEAAPEEMYTQEILTELQKRMKNTITVDFRETPIEDVLRMFAKQADVDIVKSPQVTGNVTATLTDIPLDEALDNILAAHGYGYLSTQNMLRVVPRSEIFDIPEKMTSKIYQITYADVTEVEKALTKFISSNASLSSMPGTNNLIVTDTESKIEAIDTFISEIDRITQQVSVEVRIFDVTTDEDFKLDIDWTVGRNITDAAGDTIPVTRNNPFNGPATGSPTHPFYETGTIDSMPVKRADPYAAGSFDKTNGGSIRLGLFNDAVNLDILLSMLHSQGFAKLLANPQIMVLDHEEANFEIIQEIPYKEERDSSAGGSTTSTQFKDVGVMLTVTPHITRDELLKLYIEPEFGVAEPQLVNNDGEPLVPTVNTRKLKTVALLKSGETVAIGGLRKAEVTQDTYKVPLLGDIPILGKLFISETESEQTTELLVFITPQIMESTVMTEDEANVYKETYIKRPRRPGFTMDNLPPVK